MGAFLLVFGILLLFLSFSIVNAFYPYGFDSIAEVTLEVAGLLLASTGAGLLVYGILSKSPSPVQ